eukprot:CAMPEP_0184067170 /NCGR_PEP_ID=MMETSP0957-20130417/4004_1 /TAXON_ID=627963 /ORGANISM="Aplanochytrium sp, Strain PBS07" /LENGTH=484 /DNA_ID=CAMNT_0026365469 /DNA_START=29 /DNA_END=1483 /DNA_ORIENTATION=+
MPPGRNVYKGMKECTLSQFEDLANTSDGGTWKPLRREIRLSASSIPFDAEEAGKADEGVPALEEEIIHTFVAKDPALKEEFEFKNDEYDMPDSLIEKSKEEGCYLRLDKGKDTLVAEWSKQPLSKAIAFFHPQKKMPGYTYKPGFNIVELIRGVKATKFKGQKYFTGWLYFLKIAYEAQGVVKIFSKKEGEFYYLDESNSVRKIGINEWFEVVTATNFAILPLNRRAYKGIKACPPAKFETIATENGGNIWKPLKSYKRIVLIKRKTSINPLALQQMNTGNQRNFSHESLESVMDEDADVHEEHFDLFTGKGCYMKVTEDGSLIAQWSDSPVKGAKAFFYPQKPLPEEQYTFNNTVQLAPRVAKDNPIYSAGWTQYLKMAFEVNGVLKILSREEGNFHYVNDMNKVFRIQPNSWFEVQRGRVFAALPLSKNAFDAMKECDINEFEDAATSEGGASWKPLKLYKTFDTGQPLHDATYAYNDSPTL